MNYRLKWTTEDGNRLVSGLMDLNYAKLMRRNLMGRTDYRNIDIVFDDDGQLVDDERTVREY